MDQITVVNLVPQSRSDETNQDSEPSIAVNPGNPLELVVTAFTPPDSGVTQSPLYHSTDGGTTWQLKFDVPFGEQAGAALDTPRDQSVGFAGSELFGAILRLDNGDLSVFRTDNVDAGTVSTFDARPQIDQPWVEARQVSGGTDDGRLRLYVGYNDDGTGLGAASATIDVCLDGLAATPVFTPVRLEHRSIGSGLRNGYAIRPVAHADGTVYAVLERWTAGAFGHQITTDIVVVRDDSWGSGAQPFTALSDPGDNQPGRLVATGVVINDGGTLGQERLNNDLAIAVDPSNSDIVYVAWSDDAGPAYTLRVRRSVNRGIDWSADLLTVPNATMASLAINSGGQAALMCQVVNGDRWETHLQRTTDATGLSWSDLVLANTPTAVPQAAFQPYLGDFARIVAAGPAFYGVFAASNTPDPANFPNGVQFQRNHSTSAPFQLLGNDGKTTVAPSIDPFFFRVSAGRPVLRELTPNSGPEAGGTPVTITGADFTGASAVLFGTAPAGALTVVSDSEITVTSPPGTGQVDVTVTGPGGTSAVNTDLGVFHYIPSPGQPPVSPPVQPPTQPPPTQPPVTPPPVTPPPVTPPPVTPPPEVPPPVVSPPVVPPPIYPPVPPPIAPPVPPPLPPPVLAPVPPPVEPPCVPPPPVPPPPTTLPPGPQPCANRCGTCCCCQSAALVAQVASVANTAITAITAIAANARRG
jgi:hypothetical protein